MNGSPLINYNNSQLVVILMDVHILTLCLKVQNSQSWHSGTEASDIRGNWGVKLFLLMVRINCELKISKGIVTASGGRRGTLFARYAFCRSTYRY